MDEDADLKIIHKTFPRECKPLIVHISDDIFNYSKIGYELVTTLKLDMHSICESSSLDDDNVKVYKKGTTYLIHRDKAIKIYASNSPYVDDIDKYKRRSMYFTNKDEDYNIFKLHRKDYYFIINKYKINRVEWLVTNIDAEMVKKIYKGWIIYMDDLSHIIGQSIPLDIFPLFESSEDLVKAMITYEKMHNYKYDGDIMARYNWAKKVYEEYMMSGFEEMGLLQYRY